LSPSDGVTFLRETSSGVDGGKMVLAGRAHKKGLEGVLKEEERTKIQKSLVEVGGGQA